MESNNICVSGGAMGADMFFGSNAEKANNYEVIHFAFAEHSTAYMVANPNTIIELTDEQLDEATKPVYIASRKLGVNIPTDPYVSKLIKRNYYQIRYSDSVYSVTTIVDGKPTGGTRWAIQMMIDRQADKPIYVFDQITNLWHQYDYHSKKYFVIDVVPKPTGIFAGIGTRNTTSEGIDAINSLFQ